MDNNELRRLAGIQLDEKAKWSGDVKAKVEVPEGTFTKKAAKIVSTLIKLHDGDVGKAMKALTFYINRAGKNCDNCEELDKAKEMMKAKEMKESINVIRRMAGLPILEKKDDDMEPADDASEGEEGQEEEEEEELPKIVQKIAKQAEGKDVEALEDLIMKVYQAGHKDGMKEAEEGKDKEVKEDAALGASGVPGYQSHMAAMAAKMNAGMGKDHGQDKQFDPAAGKTGAAVEHAVGDVDSMKLIKNLHSVHSTEAAAKAVADKMNATMGQDHGQDKQFDLAYCVHCMPK
jgi:hypothetical protein